LQESERLKGRVVPAPVVLYPCMRNICGRVTTSIPSPRDVARKYGPIVHTWVVSGRRPVKNAVLEGAQTAMDTKALRICVPLAASRLRFGVIASPPYTSRAVPRSSTTLHAMAAEFHAVSRAAWKLSACARGKFSNECGRMVQRGHRHAWRGTLRRCESSHEENIGLPAHSASHACTWLGECDA